MSVGYKVKQANAAKRYLPVCRVSFHTEDKCYQVKGKLVQEGEQLDPTFQLVSVSTQKVLASPAGTFTIQLIGDEWMSRVKAQDLVVIQMGYKTGSTSEELSTVMVGLIDNVRRHRDAATPEVGCMITGRDFGKMLIKEQLKFYPELGGANPDAVKAAQKFFLTEEGWLTLTGIFNSDSMMNATPAVILDTIMRYIVPKLNAVEWTVWDESRAEPVSKKVDIRNVLRYNFAKVDVELPYIFNADQYEGAIWNLMERASIKPFTELFVDVREASEAWNPGDKPRVINETIAEASDESKTTFPLDHGFYPAERMGFGSDNSAVMVVLRNTPFDKDLWERLYTHDLQAEDVRFEDLGTSDNEHYNLFWAGTLLTPFGNDFNLKKVAPPMMNESDAKRYGLSPLEVTIEGFALDASDPKHPPLLVEVSTAYTAKLKAWFEKNHEYWNGTMNVRGKGTYKIGHRVKREGIGKEFYLEGVAQNFNVFMDWTTDLQLTRGMNMGSAPDSRNYVPSKLQNDAAPERPTSEKSDAEVKAEFYTVKTGDSLWSIAAKPEVFGDGTRWSDLWDDNKEMLIARDERNISQHGKYLYAGQVIRVRKG